MCLEVLGQKCKHLNYKNEKWRTQKFKFNFLKKLWEPN
jgi:hypothetical protein